MSRHVKATNTFGEWNKWEGVRKKAAGKGEEPSKAIEVA
jgi:hypothetical protein